MIKKDPSELSGEDKLYQTLSNFKIRGGYLLCGMAVLGIVIAVATGIINKNWVLLILGVLIFSALFGAGYALILSGRKLANRVLKGVGEKIKSNYSSSLNVKKHKVRKHKTSEVKKSDFIGHYVKKAHKEMHSTEANKHCIHCGKKIKQHAKYCDSCGNKQ